MLVRESGLSMLESMMWDQGYLDTKQMAGAFQMLRSTDLVWSRLVRACQGSACSNGAATSPGDAAATTFGDATLSTSPHRKSRES